MVVIYTGVSILANLLDNGDVGDLIKGTVLAVDVNASGSHAFPNSFGEEI